MALGKCFKIDKTNSEVVSLLGINTNGPIGPKVFISNNSLFLVFYPLHKLLGGGTRLLICQYS